MMLMIKWTLMYPSVVMVTVMTGVYYIQQLCKLQIEHALIVSQYSVLKINTISE